MSLYQLINVNVMWYLIYILIRTPVHSLISIDGSIPGTLVTALLEPPLLVATIFLIASYVSYFKRFKKTHIEKRKL